MSDVVSPVASLCSDVAGGVGSLTVQFNDTSINSPVSWLWDFGDGTTSTLQNPLHTYATIGNYTVTLTVANMLVLIQ